MLEFGEAKANWSDSSDGGYNNNLAQVEANKGAFSKANKIKFLVKSDFKAAIQCAMWLVMCAFEFKAFFSHRKVLEYQYIGSNSAWVLLKFWYGNKMLLLTCVQCLSVDIRDGRLEFYTSINATIIEVVQPNTHSHTWKNELFPIF